MRFPFVLHLEPADKVDGLDDAVRALVGYSHHTATVSERELDVAVVLEATLEDALSVDEARSVVEELGYRVKGVALVHPNREQIDDLEAQISTHPGMVANGDWRALERTGHIVNLNAQALMLLLRAPREKPMVALQIMRDDDKSVMDDYSIHLDQHLHNLLASVKTFVDHTRRVVGDADDELFRSEWQARVDLFMRQPYTCFLQNLRNPTLHRRLPDWRFSMGLGPTHEFSVSLRVAELLEWDGWKAPAREVLEKAGSDGEVDVLPLIEAYLADLNTMYTWFFDQFERLHGRQVAAVNALIGQLQAQFDPANF